MKLRKMNFTRVLNLVVWMSFLGLLIGACGGSSAETSKSDNSKNGESQIVSVKTASAKIVQIPSYLEATGTLSSDAESNVAPTIAGKIIRVNFDVGSYVKKGDALVRLDARDARIRLRQARAKADQSRKAVKQSEAGVNQAIANLRQAQVRLGVKDGETFAIKDFSQVISVTAQLALAEKEFRRHEKLIETGDISRSAYDRAKAERDRLLGQMAEARSNAAVAIKAITAAEKGVASART